MEDAVDQHPVQLEPRAQRGGVHRVAVPADLLAVVGPVPGGQLDPVGGGQLGEHLALGPGVGHRRRHQGGQQRVDRGGGLRRLVGGDQVGVRGEPEKPGPDRPHVRDLRGHRAVVVLPGRRAGHRRLVQPAPQVPVGQLRHRRLARGQHQGQQVALPAALGGRRGRCFDLGLAQPGQLGPVGDQHRGGLGGDHQVLPERRRQLGQLLVERAQLLPPGLVELGPREHEVQVVALDQPDRLGVQAVPTGGHGRVHRVDPGEQLRVQPQRVGVRRRQRGHLALDLAQPLRGVRRRQCVEDDLGPVQQLPGPLQGDHGVLERRLVGRAGEGGDLGPLRGHAGQQRLAAVLQGQLGEGRQPERQRGRLRQRVLGGEVGGGVRRRGAHHRPVCPAAAGRRAHRLPARR
ncbi:unannotated protein [freshwater metagenome]|uniref:Unannotated protein n=1 Tax=freshwater metagenome TaxID=449393 RepID=A0A6J7HAF3_9ZZZZ